MAATAMRDTDSSYNSAYHRFCNSVKVNLHENLVPRCTIFRSFVCWTPMMSAKSSTGFHRPRSFVEVTLRPRWFLAPFLLLLLEELFLRSGNIEVAKGRFSGT